MMAMVHILLEQLRVRGLSIRRGDGDTLLLCGPAEEKTPDILQTVKKFKADLLELILPDSEIGVKCEQCKATVFHQQEAGKLCGHRPCPFRGKR